MKELFLSFRSEYYKPLLYGLKKYEYRKRFCSEEVRAYLYLSGKSRVVIGILELGMPIRLDKTRNDYIKYPSVLDRVDRYILNGNINAIPIKSLSLFEKPITLDEIKEEIPGFMPPQMYYVLDNHPRLKKILESRKLNSKVFIHEHNDIYYDNIAVSVSEIKASEEFRKLDMKDK